MSTITTSRPRAVAASSRVVGDGRRVAAALRADEVRARPLGPDLELLLRRRAVRVRRGDEDGAAVLRELRGELADRRRLARAVDADDEDHGGRVREVERRRLAEKRGDLVGKVGDPAARLEPLHELGRRADADVAGDQRLLEPLPVGLIARIERHHRRGDLARERAARLRERVAQPGEEPTALLLRLGRSAVLAQQFPPAPRHRPSLDSARAPVTSGYPELKTARRFGVRRTAQVAMSLGRPLGSSGRGRRASVSDGAEHVNEPPAGRPDHVCARRGSGEPTRPARARMQLTRRRV